MNSYRRSRLSFRNGIPGDEMCRRGIAPSYSYVLLAPPLIILGLLYSGLNYPSTPVRIFIGISWAMITVSTVSLMLSNEPLVTRMIAFGSTYCVVVGVTAFADFGLFIANTRLPLLLALAAIVSFEFLQLFIVCILARRSGLTLRCAYAHSGVAERASDRTRVGIREYLLLAFLIGAYLRILYTSQPPMFTDQGRVMFVCVIAFLFGSVGFCLYWTILRYQQYVAPCLLVVVTVIVADIGLYFAESTPFVSPIEVGIEHVSGMSCVAVSARILRKCGWAITGRGKSAMWELTKT